MLIEKTAWRYALVILVISTPMLACNLFALQAEQPPTATPNPIPTEAMAETPPTEAPSAPPPTADPLVVFTDGGNLWIVEGTSAPRQLTFGGADSRPQFSPDGRLVLFRRDLPPNDANLPRFELRVIAVDGSREKLVAGPGNLPGVLGTPIESDTEMLLDRLPHQVAWFPDSRGLAFNTRTEYGYGLLVNEDLWIADLPAESLTALLPDQEAGGGFAISPDGSHIALTTTTTIKVMTYPGGEQRILSTFDFINTASEYVFYPQPVWSLEGDAILVAIPSADPFVPDASGSLWRFPLSGDEGRLLATLPGNFLRDEPTWSPDQARIAYTSPAAGDDPNLNDLIIANGDASSPITYATGRLNFLGWHPDSQRFLYWQNNPGEVYLGELGLSPIRLVPPDAAIEVFDVSWITADRFVYTTSSMGAWTLRIGQLGGAHLTIASPSGDFVDFDVHR